MCVSIKNVIFLLIGFSVLISGCAGQTKPDIPADLPLLKNSEARVILTREKQIAGAGSPMVIIDIGENIQPNAMMHIVYKPIEDILGEENFATIIGVSVGDIFLWFNPELVKPLYCGAIGDGCIAYHWRWPKKNYGTFLYGTGVIVHNNCKTDLGHFADGKMLEEIRGNNLKTIRISKIPNCDFYPSGLSDEEILKILEMHPLTDFGKRISKIYVTPELDGYYALATAPDYVPSTTELVVIQGAKLQRVSIYEYVPIDDEKISRNVQVIGSVEVGDTLIWDRKPGIMRLGAAWWDGVGFMPKNITVEAGKTYYLHYTTRMGQRWELKGVE